MKALTFIRCLTSIESNLVSSADSHKEQCMWCGLMVGANAGNVTRT